MPLGRPGRGFVQHPPQDALPERDVIAGEQPLDVGAGQRAGTVGGLAPGTAISGRAIERAGQPRPPRKRSSDGCAASAPRIPAPPASRTDGAVSASALMMSGAEAPMFSTRMALRAGSVP